MRFYRVTLCVISAVFAVGRCPSVTLVHCIYTAEDIVKLLSRPGSPITLVCFDLERRYSIPKGINPFSGGAKYTGVGKFCDFRLKSPLISETAEDRPRIAMES